MKPTGIPIIRAGFVIPSLTILRTSYKAVGAFPIATIPPFISEETRRIDTSALVLPSFFAASITDESEILQITSFPKSFGFCLLRRPTRPLTSQIMLHPFFNADIPLEIASLWKIILFFPAKSKSAVECIIRLTIGHSNSSYE